MLGVNLLIDPAPLRGRERVHLAADGDVLMVHDPHLVMRVSTRVGAVDVVGGDLVSGGGVEPVAYEASCVVAGEAADPDPRGRVGRVCRSGHVSSCGDDGGDRG